MNSQSGYANLLFCKLHSDFTWTSKRAIIGNNFQTTNYMANFLIYKLQFIYSSMQTDFFNAVETEQRSVKDIVKRDAEETQEVLAGALAVKSGADFLYNRTYGFHGFYEPSPWKA